MPLSRCTHCGFTCRSLVVASEPPKCPECERTMAFVGRAALDGQRHLNGVPRLILSERVSERGRRPLAG